MAERRDDIGHRIVIEQCGEAAERRDGGDILARFAAADPGGIIVHQKLLGRPSAWVATWLRIKFVLIGAT